MFKFHASQDYEKIRRKCLNEGRLFVDTKFPVWKARQSGDFKRPREITRNPQFFVDGVSRSDVNQGKLGDCWLGSAIAILAMNKQLFSRVVPDHQTFDEGHYVGIFRFRFWHFGEWVEVVVDDRLPTRSGKLVFLSSQSSNEFWPALLEKAYAKLHGSYEALEGGWIGEAIEAFTGGIALCYPLQAPDCPTDLYGLVKRAHERGSLIGCAILENRAAELNGLVSGHAYSVTGLEEVIVTRNRQRYSTLETVRKKVQLLRIRNPWGRREWTGPWSDHSDEWSSIGKGVKNALERKVQDDGEFWISWGDFKKHFTHLEICHLNSASSPDDQRGNYWEETHVFEGTFDEGRFISMSPSEDGIDTWERNPQYPLCITEFDVDERDLCTLIISLTPKDHRFKRKKGMEVPSICFDIYKIPLNEPLDPAADESLASFFAKIPPKAGFTKKIYAIQKIRSVFSSNFSQSSVAKKVNLSPGHYCVVASTRDPSDGGDFLLRIFTERKPGGSKPIRKPIRKPIHKPIRLNGCPDCLPSLFGKSMNLNGYSPDNSASSRVNGANRMKEYDAEELQEALKFHFRDTFSLMPFEFDGFSLENCRSMVALKDDRKSGRLSTYQFNLLRESLRRWCKSFKDHKNSDHRVDFTRLGEALVSAKMADISQVVRQMLVQRFGEEIKTQEKRAGRQVERSLSFEAFVLCCIKLEHFLRVWSENEDRLPFTLDKFLATVIY